MAGVTLLNIRRDIKDLHRVLTGGECCRRVKALELRCLTNRSPKGLSVMVKLAAPINLPVHVKDIVS